MAFLGGAIVGTLLGGLAASVFGSGANSTTFTSTTNQYVETLSTAMIRNMQSVNQLVSVSQSINISGAIVNCTGPVVIANDAGVDTQIVGQLDANTTTDMSNRILTQIANEMTNNSKIRTSFLSSLPSNTTVQDIYNNITMVTRSVVTVENVNSIRQALMANQTINIGPGTEIYGTACNITNTVSVRMLAQAILNSLSNTLITNDLTSTVMNTLRNAYDAEARGLLEPLADIARAIIWAIFGIVLVVVIIVVISLVLKSTRAVPSQQNNSVLDMLLLQEALGSSKDTETATATA